MGLRRQPSFTETVAVAGGEASPLRGSPRMKEGVWLSHSSLRSGNGISRFQRFLRRRKDLVGRVIVNAVFYALMGHLSHLMSIISSNFA